MELSIKQKLVWFIKLSAFNPIGGLLWFFLSIIKFKLKVWHNFLFFERISVLAELIKNDISSLEILLPLNFFFVD